MRHLFLIGFMGAGKSTVGEALAARLGMPFVDLDRTIEQREGRSVASIFSADGEDSFRAAESAALSDVIESPPAVVACGGGVVLRDDNRAALRRAGRVVYLAVDAEEALARIGDTAGRPLLSGDAARMAPQILKARLVLYRATADVTVDTRGRSVDEVAQAVVRALDERAVSRVPVTTSRPYDVVIGVALLDRLGELMKARSTARRVAVVTDETVAPLYLDRVQRAIETAGIQSEAILVPPGESSKSWSVAGGLVERFGAGLLGRDGAVVALGGGVVGDVAGFAAATYARGVDLVHVPTTLLAQVDSAIGGKTAVDLSSGKNLAGAVWQPVLVVADTSTLASLPEREWHNGLAEVAKSALLAGERETGDLESDAPRLVDRDSMAVRRVVEMCVRFKASVVSGDEHETGRRECLNLGHTFGHALEVVAGYGTIGHGMAVAEGMRFAAGVAEEIVGSSPALSARVGALLDALDLPHVGREGLSADELVAAIRADKKARGGEARFVLLSAPGRWTVECVEAWVIAKHVERWLHRS